MQTQEWVYHQTFGTQEKPSNNYYRKYILLRKSLITIYKAIIRPHLDYGDILYDQPNNAAFCQKIESFQYKAVLAITGAIQGVSQEKNWDLKHLNPVDG